jgi:hypothetical protein
MLIKLIELEWMTSRPKGNKYWKEKYSENPNLQTESQMSEVNLRKWVPTFLVSESTSGGRRSQAE